MGFTQLSKIQPWLTYLPSLFSGPNSLAKCTPTSGSQGWKEVFLALRALHLGSRVLCLCLLNSYSLLMSQLGAYFLRGASETLSLTLVLKLRAPITPCISSVIAFIPQPGELFVCFHPLWTVGSIRAGSHVCFTIISPKSSEVPGTWQE